MEKTVISQKQRNSNIEVLRCLLMFLIVTAHVWYYGPLKNETAFWIMPVSLLIRWHVDCFIAISGWYGINFKWKKFISLWGILLFYSVFHFCLQHRHGFSVGDLRNFHITGGRFGGSYLMLMLMSPLINAGCETLIKQGHKKAFNAWLIFAIGITLNWLPRHAYTGVAPIGGGLIRS